MTTTHRLRPHPRSLPCSRCPPRACAGHLPWRAASASRRSWHRKFCLDPLYCKMFNSFELYSLIAIGIQMFYWWKVKWFGTERLDSLIRSALLLTERIHVRYKMQWNETDRKEDFKNYLIIKYKNLITINYTILYYTILHLLALYICYFCIFSLYICSTYLSFLLTAVCTPWSRPRHRSPGPGHAPPIREIYWLGTWNRK